MEYTIYTDNTIPDKVTTIRFKNKITRTHIKTKIPLMKSVNKEYIKGYLTGNSCEDTGTFENALILKPRNAKIYCEITNKVPLRVKGYIKIRDNEYIGVAKSYVFIFPLIIASAVLLFVAFCVARPEENTPLKTLLENWNIADSVEGGTVELNSKSGYSGGNKLTGFNNTWVDEEYQTIPLTNDKYNKAYAEYVIIYNNQEIYRSDFIVPDNRIDWNAYEALGFKGVHELKVVCNFYMPEYNENGDIIHFVKCSMGVVNPRLCIEVR